MYLVNYNGKGHFLVLQMQLHSEISYILVNGPFFSIFSNLTKLLKTYYNDEMLFLIFSYFLH